MAFSSGQGPVRMPWQVLQDILRVDAAAPRVTFYERTPGLTNGERIELSGKVLVNWVSKAANLLVEEFDVEPGARVGVFLPAAHWRAAYWCLAVWSVGATVVLVDSDTAPDAGDGASGSAQAVSLADVDVLVTAVPDEAFDGDQVVVTLPMLARQAASPVPAGALDEAKELSTFGDVFDPMDKPDPADVALEPHGGTFAELTDGSASSERRYLRQPFPDLVLRALAADGSVVLVRGDVTVDELVRILEQESAVPT